MRRLISVTALVGLVTGLWLGAPGGHVGATVPATTGPPVSTVEPTVEPTSAPAPTMAPATRGSTIQLVSTLPPPTTTTTTTTAPQPPSPWTVPAGSGTGRRVVYSKGRQRVWVVEANGTVARTFLVSGRLSQPNYGTFAVFSRSSYTCSISHPDTCMRWMVRFTKGPSGDNIGFHEIPRRNGVPLQSTSQLGQPLSSGCVREATADAQFMWNWAGIGTKVVVVP